MPDVAVNLIALRSADLRRAETFYNLLGITFNRERHGSGPEHLAGRLGSLVFELYPLEGGGATTSVRLGFRIPSVRETVAKLAEAGARIAIPPTSGTWGLRAVVTDPDGHRIELVERASEGASMLNSHAMSFDGQLLERGFWLYVWDMRGPCGRHLYVGRTGDSSSPHAQSPFKRIGQHLDPSPKAKGNALGRQLQREGVDPLSCTFEMTAIGPIFPERQTMAEHQPTRDQLAALERALADFLKQRGYNVVGMHPKPVPPDPALLAQLQKIVDPKFPALATA
jgi:catechol 2,3-dioxygenase-like lactoylglutathione lyase family enzyme